MREALQIIKGQREGEIFILPTKGQIFVGREESCEVPIKDPSISRRHFCVTKQEDSYFIQDMGSSNGTFVNGKRTLWQKLGCNDIISCGTCQIEFLSLKEEEISEIKKSIKQKQSPEAYQVASPTQPMKKIRTPERESTSYFRRSMPEIMDTPTTIQYKRSRKDPLFSINESNKRDTQALVTLYKMSELLHTNLSLKPLLEKLINMVLEITKAERGCILLNENGGERFEIAVFQSSTKQKLSILSISRTIANLAVKEGIASVCADAMSDNRFKKDRNSSVILHNIRSVLCVPLEGKEEILGAIYVDSLVTSHAFDNKDLELLTAIGRQAGLAVERTLLQENIQRSEQKYRTIFEKSPFCIALVNETGRIIDINSSGLQNLSKDSLSLKQHSILELFPEAKESFQKLLNEGDQFDLKDLHLRNIGNLDELSTIINLKGIPLFDQKGVIEGALVISEDITDSKRLQSQIIQQDKMATVGLLAAGVAHEFNNIIAGMMGYAQLMLKKKNIEPEKLANVVVEQCHRARGVISRLLNFSRRKDVPKEIVRLEGLLEDVFLLVERELLKNNITVKRNFEKVPDIVAQAGELQQVFLNLVINAMHAIGKDGSLTVSLKRKEDVVQVIFEDTGIGIPENILSRIFEPFFTTKENTGTGLGLSVSYNIIKSYKGEVFVTSQKNVGTTFTIELPIPKGRILKEEEITEKLEREELKDYIEYHKK